MESETKAQNRAETALGREFEQKKKTRLRRSLGFNNNKENDFGVLAMVLGMTVAI